MKNRKELPHFAKIKKQVDIDQLRQFCFAGGYLDYSTYTDIQYSSNSNHQSFLVANGFSKENFFKEGNAPYLEGDQYKQLYLTDIDPSLKTSSEKTLELTTKTIFSRTKRLDSSSSRYVPEADELNYTVRNDHVKGVFEEILDSFKSQVTRVRLAVLMPGMAIKPHVDYDPSYITRYHIPICTSDSVIFGTRVSGVDVEFTMPSDGSVYFLNTGLVHWVRNDGDQPRLHLIIDTHGQDDLIM